MQMGDDAGRTHIVGAVRPLRDEIHRARVVERLHGRWRVPVMLMVAPGGYGKSVALAQARRANTLDPSGIDLHLACRPTDRGAAHLASRILELTTAPGVPEDSTVDDLAVAIVAALARSSPTPICLQLDDLHHLGDDSEGCSLLAALVRTLPTNAHLLLAGRALPELPLSRLRAADGVAEIGPNDLVFDAAEARSLAEQHGVDDTRIDLSAGWPALLRLALVVGRSASLDFLIEEVVHDLDDATLHALVATIAAGDADDAMLDHVQRGLGTSAVRLCADLLERVPLLSQDQDTVRAHDLWREAFDQILDTDSRYRIAVEVARWFTAEGDDERALEAAILVGAWDEAQAAIVAALESGDAQLSSSLTARWQAMFPPDRIAAPALCLLRGSTARMAGDMPTAIRELDTALDAFEARGEGRGRAAAALERGMVAWLEGDADTMFRLLSVGEELRAEGIESMAWLTILGDAAIHDLTGEPGEARRLLATIDTSRLPRAAVVLLLRWQSTLSLLLGESAEATAFADRMPGRDIERRARAAAATAHWQHGDPGPMIAERDPSLRRGAVDNVRDEFLSQVVAAVVESSFGIVAEVSDLGSLATDRSRDRTFIAIATAAAGVAAGDEDLACSQFAEAIASIGIDDPLCRGELRRYASLTTVLDPAVRALMDREPPPGKLGERHRLAVLLLDHRSGAAVDWSLLPDPPDVFTGLPLRWALELAAGASAAGDPAGLALAEYLVDVTGAVARDLLEQMVDSDAAVGTLLELIPRQPAARMSVVACGPLTVRGSEIVDDGLLRRVRVRELLGLLILRSRVTVDDAASLLWPGLAPDGAKNNLRTTVAYLRRLLEPTRHRREAPFHVRRRGDVLWLERSEHLDVDVWEIEARITRGRDLEREGRTAAAMDEYRVAVDRWSDDLLVDLRGHDELQPEVTFLDREITEAALRVAEWAVASGDHDRAIAAAERVLHHDPFAERAHAVLINTHLERGEVQAAGAAWMTCLRALEEIGAEPSPATMMVIKRLGIEGPPG